MNFSAGYLSDSLGAALLAALAYSEASNQQSYQQSLWKTRLPARQLLGIFAQRQEIIYALKIISSNE
ncbi:MAG: hypothetical protein ACREQ2_24380 [Candidatus Binatia bacterium]